MCRSLLGHCLAGAAQTGEREGQQTVEGGELPVRRNHSLKVLVKRDSRWLILADLYMDARDEQTFVRQV